jgi:16S rRNA (guanine966-N2)-methyltransferase
MRIIAGRWKGRAFVAPPGLATRPTSDRARQAIFDQLWHAPWAGRAVVENAAVLDGFAGTGAMGLEALSRGAARAFFMEQDRAALAALRANIAGCKAGDTCRVIAGDVTAPPIAAAPCTLVFLDPPYGKGLVPRALAALQAKGWIAPGALIIAETGRA